MHFWSQGEQGRGAGSSIAQLHGKALELDTEFR